MLWIRAINDGLLKSKGKRLPSARAANDYSTVRNDLMAFIATPLRPIPSVAKFQKSCPIEFGDPLLELVPENYLDEPEPTEQEMETGMEQVIRNTVAALVGEGPRQ